MAPEPHVSLRAVAARWGVCRNTVLKLVDRGELKAMRIGGQLRFRMATLKAYEEELEAAPPTKRKTTYRGRQRRAI